MDFQKNIDASLSTLMLRYDDEHRRLYVRTGLDGHSIMWLERELRRLMGIPDLELLCESVPDANKLRTLKEMRGVKVDAK